MMTNCAAPGALPCGNDGMVCPSDSKCAANQNICIYTSCGNANVDPGEVCDDGNIIDGDGCSADCKSREGCGDGIVNKGNGEVCDDGNNTNGDGCSKNCRSVEVCGNNVVDPGETCDDGNRKSNDGCKADCSSKEECGNGTLDDHLTINPEVCDDGNTINNDGCSNNCASNEACGNGAVDKGEQCDDDNESNNDGCLSGPRGVNDIGICTLAFCGDGYVREDAEDGYPGEIEACDGNGRGKGGATKVCNDNCTKVQAGINGGPAGCGDGSVNDALGEECDNGVDNGTYNNSCSAQCTLSGVLVCGDGIPTAPEVCDDGKNVGAYGKCSAGCNALAPYCGDKKKDATVNGVAIDESCDDGDANSDKYSFESHCNAECSGLAPYCGDNTRQKPQEKCDDGPQEGYNKCKNDCSGKDRYCGDGKVEPNGVENCDNGTNDGSYGPASCTDNCLTYGPSCGDSAITNDEECDDGDDTVRDSKAGDDEYNGPQYGGCTENCKLGSYCGDGDVQKTSGGERCDLGNVNAGDIPIWDRPLECHDDCSGYCGDSIINNKLSDSLDDFEGCDKGTPEYNDDNVIISGNGFDNKACRADCSVCGDGIKDDELDKLDDKLHNETCDVGDDNGEWAQNKADSCNLTCDGPAGYCGDGRKEEGKEQCDKGTNGDSTCTAGCKTKTTP